jgi:hypothetical protein
MRIGFMNKRTLIISSLFFAFILFNSCEKNNVQKENSTLQAKEDLPKDSIISESDMILLEKLSTQYGFAIQNKLTTNCYLRLKELIELVDKNRVCKTYKDCGSVSIGCISCSLPINIYNKDPFWEKEDSFSKKCLGKTDGIWACPDSAPQCINPKQLEYKCIEKVCIIE